MFKKSILLKIKEKFIHFKILKISILKCINKRIVQIENTIFNLHNFINLNHIFLRLIVQNQNLVGYQYQYLQIYDLLQTELHFRK